MLLLNIHTEQRDPARTGADERGDASHEFETDLSTSDFRVSAVVSHTRRCERRLDNSQISFLFPSV